MGRVQKIKTTIKNSEMENLENGIHFWALLENKLVVMIKDGKYYFTCGGWEGDFKESEFDFIEVIKRPDAYKLTPLYYAEEE